MPTVAELNEAIAAAALEPAEATGGAGSYKARTIAEMILARDAQIAAEAEAAGASSGWGGLRLARVVPPGSV